MAYGLSIENDSVKAGSQTSARLRVEAGRHGGAVFQVPWPCNESNAQSSSTSLRADKRVVAVALIGRGVCAAAFAGGVESHPLL